MKPPSASLVVGILILRAVESVLNSPSNTIKSGRRVIKLREGQVSGRIEESSGQFGEVYDSIPYAEPPDGELRFEFPRPVPPWSGILNASRLSHCTQHSVHEASHTSMDCLHVKSFLDANRHRYKEKLPVVLWIHGGSYQFLGKALYNTSGILTSLSSRKVIFVAAGYRLGMLGFLSLLDPDLPGNYALRDITLALRFIHANAAAFGADPKRISIAGLIFSTLSFSGSIYSPWAVRTAATRNHSLALITAAGCRRETVVEMKSCMQELPLAVLRHHEQKFMNETEEDLFEMYRMGCAAFTPVQDAFMGESSHIPHRIERLGAIIGTVKVPALLSTTADERFVATRDLVRVKFDKKSRSVINFLPRIMPKTQASLAEVVSTITKHYFGGNITMGTKAFEKSLTNSQNGEQFAAAHAEAIDYSAANQSVYVLKSDVNDGRFPTWHGLDVWLLFDCFHMANRTGVGNWTYANWRSFDSFRNKLADVVTEFVSSGSLLNMSRFTRDSRRATKISLEGAETLDADTDDYYFWRKTIPAIESLHDSPTIRVAVKHLVCTQTYQIPFYAATTLLMVCMLSCGFFFSQRTRSLSRDRKALRHNPLQR